MSKPLVLITGATGLIGFKTLVVALRSGYSARIVLRNPSQEAKIRAAPSIQPFLSDISFAIIPDLTLPNAFATAIQGVHYVIHVASPTPFHVDVPQMKQEGKTWKETMYDPAVNGTLEVLRAAARPGSTVKRIALTASGNVLACLTNPAAAPTDIRPCPSMEEALAVPIVGLAYKESKILALHAAMRFVEEENPPFGLFVVCPGYVQGRHELCESVEEVRRCTAGATLDVATGGELGAPPRFPHVTTQVWVGDVARAHVDGLALRDVKQNEVFVLAGNGEHSRKWAEVAEMIKDMFPEEVRKGVLRPNTEQVSMDLPFEGRSTEERLGFRFAGPEVWAREAVEQYLELSGREGV